jgi:hypothetical protein
VDLSEWHELNFLWNHRNTKGETPFYLLLERCKVVDQTEFNFDKLMQLIKTCDINLNMENNDGETSLQTLLSMPSLFLEEKKKVLAVAKKVPPRVPSVTTKRQVSKTILHSMLQTPNVSMDLDLVKTITSQFMNEINAQDEDGNTPLMVLLQKLFADESRDSMKYYHLVEKKTKEHVKSYYHDSDDEDQLDNEDNSAYEEIDLFPIMEYLITCPGTDFTVQNNAGDTALHMVCRYFHVGALEAMLCNINSYEQASKYCVIAFRLLDGGADVTIKNNAGETALDYAPMLMHHYQHVYPLIKEYKPFIKASTGFGSPYDDLAEFDPE